MKIIINAEPDELPEVLALILEKREHFERGEPRYGWGWQWRIPNGETFFLRQIKGGISATPVRAKLAPPTPGTEG